MLSRSVSTTATTTPEEQVHAAETSAAATPGGPHFAGMVTAVLGGALAVMLCINWRFRFDSSDDAYIHLRIARNLLRTGHPYFNVGEPVMATSSPVWTLVLVLNEFIFGTRNTIWLWNAVFASVAATVAYWLAWTWVETRGAQDKYVAVLLPVGVLATLADSSFLGMETPLATALLLLAGVACVRARAWALPLLSLAAFTRYELGALLAITGLACLGTRKARTYGAIPACVIAGVFTAWLLSQFGTIIPTAIEAKSRGYSLTASQAFAAVAPPPSVLIAWNGVLLLIGSGILAHWVLEAVSDTGRREGVRIVALGLILWGCTLAALYVWRRAFVFAWYKPLVWTPILVGGLLMTLIDHRRPRRMLAMFLLVTLFLAPCVMLGLRVRLALVARDEADAIIAESGRVHEYLAVGAALHQVCPQSQLLTSEIGGLGYGFQGYIYDGFGIASPDAIKYHPLRVPEERGNGTLGAIPPRFALAKKPDLIVTYDIFGEAVVASPDIRAEYADLRFDPLLPQDAAAGLQTAWGIRTLHVFVKKSGGCPVATVHEKLSAILTPKPK